MKDERRARALMPAGTLVFGLIMWIGALAVVVARTEPRLSGPPVTPLIPQTAAKSSPAPAKKPSVDPNQWQSPTAKYVGEDTCLTCHDAQKQKYVESAHHRAMDTRTPAAKQSCETCHGAGSEHAEDPVNKKLKDFKKMAPEAINATCTTCHNRGEHALWEGSAHETRGLSCISCHSVHNYKAEKAQLKAKTQTELCATCHRDKAAKVDRSGHMPLREGKMECTTCHNAHGSTNVKLLRKGDSVAELCTSCHADKRGPFLWEHAPSRDGCVTCHDPHGSSNERMLVSKPPILCQRCHVGTRHPSTIYDSAIVGAGASPSVRVYGRTCVECHSAIHGSNHPSGQRFIR